MSPRDPATALPGRADLLAILYLHSHDRRQVGRAERWRSRAWTAARVAAEAERVAAALAGLGVSAGDRVALWLDDGPLWHAAFFGTLRAGAVAVPLDVALDRAIVREQVAGLELRAWVTERAVPELGLALPRLELDWRRGVAREPEALPSMPPDDPSRIAEIVLTSGTTGAPRAVPLTHANLRAVLDALGAVVARRRALLRLAPRLRLAVALPLSHLYGQVMGAFVPALLDAHVALVPVMPAHELARRLRDERAWALATTPRTLALLAGWLRAEGEARWGARGMERRLEAARGRRWPLRWVSFLPLRRRLGFRLVAVVSGGAALDPELESFWRAIGIVVVQGYGLTETAPLVTLNDPFDARVGSLGRPLPGVEVRLAADGEILVRGPNVVSARLEGRAVDVEGWLHTGDRGRWDAEGGLTFLGRTGERIVTPAGVNVDLPDVAARLRRARGVIDAVALERPWGERGVVAAVLAAAPGSDPGAAVRAANAGLPDAARVRSWHVWPEPDLPRTRTGKPRLAEIRAWLEERAPAATGSPSGGDPGGALASQPHAALAALVARVAGVEVEGIGSDTRLGDVLGSLERVELVTRLEMVHGLTSTPAALDPERTIASLTEELAGRPVAPEARAGAADPERRRAVAFARWRGMAPVRAGRRAFQELFIRPLWRSCVALDAAGAERLGGVEPPFLVAANHLSILDPGAVLFGLPSRFRGRIAATAMWEHFERRPVKGPLQYALAVFGLDLIPLVQLGDWRPTLRIAGAVADRGGCPLVYPEGERSRDGRLLPFRPGLAVMARELHLPIVPCGAAGLLAVLPRGARWARRIWLGRARVAVRFGEPLDPPRPGEDPGLVTAELRARIEPLVAAARAAAGRF